MSKQCHFSVSVVLFFSTLVSLSGCKGFTANTNSEVQAATDFLFRTERIEQAFANWQSIGEGSAFLTAQITLSPQQAEDAQVSALILDEDGMPLRHVTGFPIRSQAAPTDHLWFQFLLYAPQPLPLMLRKSAFIEFQFSNPPNLEIKRRVPFRKVWDAQRENRIYDRPIPDDEINGVMVLRDYTFLADGDPRQPSGLFVEGAILGDEGRWNSFLPMSAVKGNDVGSDQALETDRGWLELSTGSTHSMQEAVAPQSPYVEGWWDGKGMFHAAPMLH